MASPHPRSTDDLEVLITMWFRAAARALPRRFTLTVLIAIVFVIQFGISLSDLPTTKISQDIICIQRYHNTTLAPGYVPEDWCHADDIQAELNTVSIGLLVSQTVGSALAALPFGSLSDRIGRVSVFALVGLGLLASQSYIIGVLRGAGAMPLRSLWAAGGFLLIGGGWNVAEAVVFAMVSDMAPEARRANYFQWIACAVLVAQLLAQPASGGLMTVDPLLPMYLTLGLIALGGLAIVLFLPETRAWSPAGEAQPPSTPLPPQEGDGAAPARQRRLSTGIAATPPSMRTVLSSLRDRQLLLLVPGTALSVPLVSAQIDILFRLMPIRYGWTLDESALLVSLRSGVTVLVIGALIPLARWLWARLSPGPSATFVRDLRVAQASAVLLAVGALLTMLLWRVAIVIVGVVLSSLGSGVPMLCRSLVVGIARGRGMDSHIGGLFGLLAILETVAYIVFELGIGALFNVGLGGWMGWPFLAALVVSVCIAACLFFVGAPAPGRSEGEAMGWGESPVPGSHSSASFRTAESSTGPAAGQEGRAKDSIDLVG